ncbi:hydantoinase [Candidatus Poribacteria bacterium]|nr:MAG: hydantoinase [Candidatus Poribacteria bacterium]
MNSTQKTHRLGIDIGGTFTDIVLIGDDGTVLTQKVPSTPDNYAEGIVAGLAPLLPRQISEVVHGTTVATNTILERKGALTGLITTKGFRDVLEIGRLRYPRLYDLTWEKPLPLALRRLRREVEERIDANGEIVQPLDIQGAREVIRWMLRQNIESLAVCLINAYINPDHERQLGELIHELAPDLPVSLSCDVLPEIKEYERTSTTVINAYLQPVVSRYLHSLSGRLNQQLTHTDNALPLYVMQSNGGVMSAESAAEIPIHIIESGPAAGVIASLTLAGRVGLTNVLTLDMGGTTAKASLIEDGQIMHSPEYQVGGGVSVGTRLSKGGGYPLRVPAIDIAEVGAGGGSIVYLDTGGALRVGPQSAGAVPGPACYGIGGEEPTLTDANVVLGYLNPEHLAGGALPLNAEKAHQTLHDKIAAPLNLSASDAAHGVYRIAAANMARAARAVSLERGRDPREFVLCAFGGNGPLHATELAESLGMKRILIPPSPGLFSAFGLLYADIAYHLVQTYKRLLTELDINDFKETLGRLETSAREGLMAEGENAAQVSDSSDTSESSERDRNGVVLQRAVDLRYAGQSSELTLPIVEGDIGQPQFFHTLGERFADDHERTYGHRAPDDPIEVVNLRLTAVIPTAKSQFSYLQPPSSQTLPPNRRCYFGRETGWLEVPVLSREGLTSESESGPFIVEEYDTTILVPPRCTALRDEWGNIVIEMGT